MAEIDNMRGDTLRVVEENTLDNMRGVTQRVKEETTIDNTRGVTYRVYNVNGGSTPVIDELNVTPSTSAQVITAPEGTDGYSPVNVAAVTSSIDANITAGNIKKDVSILGVTGSYEGNVPTGTMYIISNGTYNVADKAIANVQVPTAAPTYYIEKTVDANGKLISGTQVIDFTGVTDVESNVLSYAYAGAIFPENTTISLNPLTNISGSYAFQSAFSGCSHITGVNLSSLITISGANACQQMFYYDTDIASINLSSLTTISGAQACRQMFSNCGHLTSATFDSLSTLTGASALQQMFNSCSALTSLSFPALKSTSFGTQTNQFNNMLSGVTGCTVHFPSNLDPAGGSTVISSLTGYPNFGGTNTTVLFDLPATE